MIIKAKHHWFWHPFFVWYSKRIIRKHFFSVNIFSDIQYSNKSVLLLCNHFSWWDGFIVNYINSHLVKKKFHILMLEEQLQKHWYFNGAGAFSIKKKSKSLLETISYTKRLLEESDNLVAIFPQGRIQSMHIKHIQFGKGLNRIVEEGTQETQIIFSVVLVEYFVHKKPSLYIYLHEFISSDQSTSAFEDSYNEFYINCLQRNIQIEI